MQALGLGERPRSLGLRQACAAVGQGRLMPIYSRVFDDFGGPVGVEGLLTLPLAAARPRRGEHRL